jgi:tRNA pseudouridine38-40 synthase
VQKYKLTISYDGTDYAGWQVQDNKTAIQPLIQRSLETILRHPVSLSGSGRTDAGVHALGQVAHFESPLDLEPSRIRFSLNAILPKDIRILSLEKVDSKFHARYSALSKIYHYHIHLSPTLNPFTKLYSYHFLGPFEKTLLKQATPYFLGTHDFSSFANNPDRGSASRDPIRTLFRIDCIDEPQGIRLEFEGNGFLYKMVRNITGTLLSVASKKMPASHIPLIFSAKDRKKASTCAPPHGLFLIRVNYDQKDLPKTPDASPLQKEWSQEVDDEKDIPKQLKLASFEGL